jgi:hypothetical protein
VRNCFQAPCKNWSASKRLQKCCEIREGVGVPPEMRREESEDVRAEIGPLADFFHNISFPNPNAASGYCTLRPPSSPMPGWYVRSERQSGPSHPWQRMSASRPVAEVISCSWVRFAPP